MKAVAALTVAGAAAFVSYLLEDDGLGFLRESLTWVVQTLTSMT